MGRGERKRLTRSINWTCCDTILTFCIFGGIALGLTLGYFVGKPLWKEAVYQKTSCAVAHQRHLGEQVCERCYDHHGSSEESGGSSRRHHGRHRWGDSGESRGSSSEETWEEDMDELTDKWMDDLDFDPEAWWDEAREWLRNKCGVDLPDDIAEDWDDDWDWGSLLEDWAGWRWVRPDSPDSGPGPHHSGPHHSGSGESGPHHPGPGRPGRRHKRRAGSGSDEDCPVFDCYEIEVFYREPKTGKSRFGMLYYNLDEVHNYPKCSVSACCRHPDRNAQKLYGFLNKLPMTRQATVPCYVSAKNPQHAIFEKEVSPMPAAHAIFWPCLFSVICFFVVVARRCYFCLGGKFVGKSGFVKQKIDPELRYMPSAGLPGPKAPLPAGGDVTSGVGAGAVEKDPATLGEEAKTGLSLVPATLMTAQLPPYKEAGNQKWAFLPPPYADPSDLPGKEDSQNEVA